MLLVTVVLHASAAVASLVCALVAWRRPRVFAAAEVLLAVSMTALAIDLVLRWPDEPTVVRAVFTALGVLGVFALVRLELVRRRPPEQRRPALTFAIITLLDAFAVVSTVRAGAPIPVVVAVGVAIPLLVNLVVLPRVSRADQRRERASAGSSADRTADGSSRPAREAAARGTAVPRTER